jgi:hypothetical protein
MPNAFRAAADVGLRRQRLLVSGRFTPDTHRGYSEASSWVAGAGERLRETVRFVPIVGKLFTSAPGAGDGLVDKLVSAVTGTRVDPATLMGYPVSTPADWAAQANGDTKYAFYVEGTTAGFVRGGLFGVLVGALATTATHVLLRRRSKT